MNDKIASLLEKIADKLDVTASQLWHVMTFQAYLNAALSAIEIFVFTFAWLLWTKNALRHLTPHKNEAGYEDQDWEEEGALLGWLSIFVPGAIIVIFDLYAIEQIVTGLFNPQFWALSQLLPH